MEVNLIFSTKKTNNFGKKLIDYHGHYLLNKNYFCRFCYYFFQILFFEYISITFQHRYQYQFTPTSSPQSAEHDKGATSKNPNFNQL